MDEDSSMEQKMWQVYSFGKRNVFRLHLNESREAVMGGLLNSEGPELGLNDALSCWYIDYFFRISELGIYFGVSELSLLFRPAGTQAIFQDLRT